jgi:hypothetical protein
LGKSIFWRNGIMRNFTFAALPLVCALCVACEGSQQICSAESRTAITGALTDGSGALVKPQSVTARVNGGYAHACSVQYGSYYCGERGGGTYKVSVTSGSETIVDEVEVGADECHVTEAVALDFVISGEPGLGSLGCPDHRWLLAEIAMSKWSYQDFEDQRFFAELLVLDGKLRVYAPPGLAGAEQAISIRVSGGITCDPGFATVATLTFVPQSKGCGYEVVSRQLAEEDIDYCRQL